MVPAHPGSPRQRALKQLLLCVLCLLVIMSLVVSTSAVDCMEKFNSEVTYLLSEMLNLVTLTYKYAFIS